MWAARGQLVIEPQRFPRFGHVRQLCRAIDDQILPEAVAEDEERYPWIADEIPILGACLCDRDQKPALMVGRKHVRELRSPILADTRQHGLLVRLDVLFRLGAIHLTPPALAL